MLLDDLKRENRASYDQLERLDPLPITRADCVTPWLPVDLASFGFDAARLSPLRR
ncbi:MAG: hypothetical protein V4773_28365 [Verrucomicrobiota bacterium]